MSRFIYVDGYYQRYQDAAIHVEDRGLQFGDGVYEVCEIFNGHIIDEPRHLERLNRSLSELKIDWPCTPDALRVICRQCVIKDKVKSGLVYIQITRGVSRRDHAFPSPEVKPTLIVFARATDRKKADAAAAAGVNVISVKENRWDRVDIKSTSLLPNILARQTAKDAGAREAWFVDDKGFVTEGSYSNAWIVTDKGELKTRPAEHGILRGITRSVIMDMADKLQLKIVEQPFTIIEAQNAKEAFITAATTLVMPIVNVDGKAIGTGKPGAIATQLRAEIHKFTDIANPMKL